MEQSNGSFPFLRSNDINEVFWSLWNTPFSIAKLNQLSISVPAKSQISKYNSGGDHLDPAICPFEDFLERRGAPPYLMGPPKILYPSVRSWDLTTAYKLVHQNLFRLIQICVKTFKYVINCHRVRGDLIIRWFYCANICLRLAFFQPKGQ